MKKKEIPRLLASIALALLGIAFLFIVLGLSYNENLIISGVICFGSSPILFIIAGILGYKWKEELEEIHGIKWLYIIIPNLLLIVIITFFVDLFVGIIFMVGFLLFCILSFVRLRRRNICKINLIYHNLYFLKPSLSG